MEAPMGKDRMFQLVVDELLQLTREHGFAREQIVGSASLVEDLGLDSIRFLDLTVALERALGVDEFPMQRWQDMEAGRPDKRYTVASLAELCAAIMGADAGVGTP
jgi:acyl carrier protein